MDVSKKVRMSCLLKVGGSGAAISEMIFVIQLLGGIIQNFPTRFSIKKP